MQVQLNARFVTETEGNVVIEIDAEPVRLTHIDRVMIDDKGRERQLTREERRDFEEALDSFTDRRFGQMLAGLVIDRVY